MQCILTPYSSVRIRTKHLLYHVPVSLSISISSSICLGVLILFTCGQQESAESSLLSWEVATLRLLILNPTLNGKWYLVRIVHVQENTGREVQMQRPSEGTEYDSVRGMPQRKGEGSKRGEVTRDRCLLIAIKTHASSSRSDA